MSDLARLRSRLLGLLALLMFLAGLFTAMDLDRTWMALLGEVAWTDWPTPMSQTSAFLRMFRSLLCLGLAAMIVPEVRLRLWDDRLLTASFVFAVIGDAFLIFRTGMPNWFFLAGVGSFLVCHGVLIARHMRGFRDDLGKSGVVPRLIVAAVAIVAVDAALVWHFWEVLKPSLDLVYVGMVSVSLWAALGAAIRADDADFPKANRWLIAGGLLLFWACDIALGINARMVGAEGFTPAALKIGMVPDLTYSWALIALALSGFRWDVLTGRSPAPAS